MKLSSLKSLIVGLLILLTATTAYADYEAQRPKRRRSQKQYTSPEEIKAERDSIACDTLVITEIVSASTTAPEQALIGRTAALKHSTHEARRHRRRDIRLTPRRKENIAP